MNEAEIGEFARSLPGVEVVVAAEGDGSPEVAWGDSFFFHGDDRKIPFATIVTKDYEGFDMASNLNRPGVFRLNLSVSKETFRQLFADGGDDHDFTALDTVLPHPVYGTQGWVCILNPGPATSDLAQSLLVEAYERAMTRHERRESRS